MAYTFEKPEAAGRHRVQYFEIFGNRGIYSDGWFAGTVHLKPWGKVENRLSADKWELYHVAEDFSMSKDVAAKYPEKLRELQSLFLGEAVKYKVLPIDDRRIQRANSQFAGRPDIMDGRKELKLFPGMEFMPENGFINTKNASFEITADIEANAGETNGVIVSQAGRFGGWSFYVKDGRPVYYYNFLGLASYAIRSTATVPSGKCRVKVDFAYDGKPKLGGGGTATLYINGRKVGSGRVDRTQFAVFSADETANVGIDRETPVSPDYTEETSKFTGKIGKVTIKLK